MKKILLILSLIFLLEPVYAATASVDNLDYIQYVPEECIGECGKSAGRFVLEKGYEIFTVDDFRADIKCEEHNARYEFPDGGAQYAYKFATKMDDEISKTIECPNGCKLENENDDEIEDVTKDLLKKYTKVTINGETYYIYEDFVKDLRRSNNLGKNDIIVYTKIKENNEEKLSVLYFKKNEMNFYKEFNMGKQDSFSKIKIEELYGNKFNETPNDSTIIDNGVFIVCEECRKCKFNGNCNESVASSGATLGNSGELYLSKYCEKHACAFVWEVANNGDEIFEGLKCIDGNNGNSDYCDKHKCKNCDKPIVGVNMNNALADPINYQGENETGYSKYCADEYCLFQGCQENRISLDSNLAIRNSTKGIYENFGQYCSTHSSKCGICGKNEVSISAYEAVNKMICQSCIDKHFDKSSSGYKLKVDALKHCQSCNGTFTTVFEVNGRNLCYECKSRQEVNNNVQQAKRCGECRKIVDALYNVNGKDVCYDCSIAIMGNVLGGNSNSNDVADTIVDIVGIAGGNPETLNRIIADIGAENIQDVENKINDVFSANGICRFCASYLTQKHNGERYCPNCNRDENGNEIPAVKPSETTGTQSTTSTTPTGGSYTTDAGYLGDISLGSMGSSTTAIGGFGSSTGLTTGTANPSTCVHANYPVPNTVTFSNVTDSTHSQMWTCSNCNTAMTQQYEHTFLDDGKCVCGYTKQTGLPNEEPNDTDVEEPEVIEVTPNGEDLIGGEVIRIKVSDNEGLAEIEYLCLWGDKKKVTKEISGKEAEIELGKLPTESGEYYLFINSVTDIAGNELSVNDPYIFVVIKDIVANKPMLTDELTPVNWKNGKWEETTEEKWEYNYNSVALTTNDKVEGNGDGKWANAMTEDGSMFVWIPRYTYKITTGENSSGISWNNLDKSGTNKIEIKFSDGIKDNTNNEYISHPAFTFGEDELTGIWVAKYEASRDDATDSSEGEGTVVTFKPGVISWRNLTVNDMFNYSFELNRDLNSHLMKNSEWGAVAYLTNAIGRVPYINNSSNYITGNAGKSQDAKATGGEGFAWNTKDGVKASTTHNVYGIYDMSGGAAEYVAAFLDNDKSNLKTYAKSLINAAKEYKDVYSKGPSDNEDANYDTWSKITGDALVETSENAIGATSWDEDYSYTPSLDSNVFSRGGYYSDESGAGIFSFNSYDGDAYSHYGFRAVLIVK